MTRRVVAVAAVLLIAASMIAVSGCAATSRKSADMPSSPELMAKEIADIRADIVNAEEMYKAKLTELQMEDSIELRREVNELSVELEYLRARKVALEEALAESQKGTTGS
jgi:hypothetical protein